MDRTARATGTITNTGSAIVTYRARLLFAGIAGEPSGDVALLPGETSALIALPAVRAYLSPGTEAGAKVILDRVSPDPAQGIATSPSTFFTEPTPGIQLTAGENVIVYTGPAQSVEEAFASIMPYVPNAFVVAYIFYAGDFYPTTIIDTMVPGATYRITVTQNCLWY